MKAVLIQFSQKCQNHSINLAISGLACLAYPKFNPASKKHNTIQIARTTFNQKIQVGQSQVYFLLAKRTVPLASALSLVYYLLVHKKGVITVPALLHFLKLYWIIHLFLFLPLNWVRMVDFVSQFAVHSMKNDRDNECDSCFWFCMDKETLLITGRIINI